MSYRISPLLPDAAGTTQLPGVLLTPERVIATQGGEVLHAIKSTSLGFCGFGEAYFSVVLPNVARGWKKHLRMTLNLVVPVGLVTFYLAADKDKSPEKTIYKIDLGPEKYCRLTVPPGIWVAFSGGKVARNVLLNTANMEHDPQEAVSADISAALLREILV